MQLRSVKKGYWVDTHQSRSPSETLRVVNDAIAASGLSVLNGLEEITDFAGTSIPVFRVIVDQADSREWGKGLSKEQCQVSATMERIERFSAARAPTSLRNKCRIGRRVDLPDRVVDLEATGFCNLHYFLYPDLSTIGSLSRRWVDAYSLTHKEPVLLPASRVFLGYRDVEFPDFSDSTGLAANSTIEEAIIQGLAEVIERHVYHCFYLGQDNYAPRIDLESTRSPELKDAIASLESLGFVIIANDHSSGAALPTISSLCFQPEAECLFEDRSAYVHFGTAPDPEVALMRCITETIQSVAVRQYKRQRGSHAPSNGGVLPSVVVDELGWRLASDGPIEMSSISSAARDDIKDEIDVVVQKLSSVGTEVIVADLTDPLIKIPVVRVICTFLQPNFLMLGWSANSFKSRVTKHLSLCDEVHAGARAGTFFEQQVLADFPKEPDQ
jgi:YcaO-like protein with predicted kinase domain